MHEFTGLHQHCYNTEGTLLMFSNAERQQSREQGEAQTPSWLLRRLEILPRDAEQPVVGFLYKKTIVQAELD